MERQSKEGHSAVWLPLSVQKALWSSNESSDARYASRGRGVWGVACVVILRCEERREGNQWRR